MIRRIFKRIPRRIKELAPDSLVYFISKRYLKPPVKVCFQLTTRCNLRCKMCDIYTRKSSELSLQEIAELFKDLKSVGCEAVDLTGGEPLLRKDVPQIIQAGKRVGLEMNLYTNGYLLDRERLKRIVEAGIDAVGISVDGIGDTHDEIRGVEGVYKGVVNAFELLNEYPSLKKMIATVVMESNMQELPQLFELADKYNAELTGELFTIGNQRSLS